MALGLRRADFVYDAMVKRGISEDRLSTVSYGKRRLLVPNAQNEAEHEQNRRVEIKIVNDILRGK
jgi:outer membrane protein OmpA-like peptidoglycan-associated protein